MQGLVLITGYSMDEKGNYTLKMSDGTELTVYSGLPNEDIPVLGVSEDGYWTYTFNGETTLVPHNATIFKGTVEANLRMAKPDATEAELWAALEQVNLADFCRSQDGLQTALHEGGSNLSGGQRQRLAMARALLHDTPIYLFDEATSNVDAESENDIMAAIRSLAGRKTVILISHRLANVVDSDCIYVLDKGRIAERGTHAELLKKQGAYSRLYTAQKQLETLEKEDA